MLDTSVRMVPRHGVDEGVAPPGPEAGRVPHVDQVVPLERVRPQVAGQRLLVAHQRGQDDEDERQHEEQPGRDGEGVQRDPLQEPAPGRRRRGRGRGGGDRGRAGRHRHSPTPRKTLPRRIRNAAKTIDSTKSTSATTQAAPMSNRWKPEVVDQLRQGQRRAGRVAGLDLLARPADLAARDLPRHQRLGVVLHRRDHAGDHGEARIGRRWGSVTWRNRRIAPAPSSSAAS